MASVLMPIPSRDFDPSEVAISWRVLTDVGHRVSFATPDGRPGVADTLMLDGRGLDLWGWIPGLRALPLIGLLLRANRDARHAYAALERDANFRFPLRWDAIEPTAFDGLLLPGGHRARGMQEYLESSLLQGVVARFFAADKPVGAICHGVLLAARSYVAGSDRSVLFGRRTTALTWALEKSAWSLARISRFWEPQYYRTYSERSGQPRGYMSVQQEVTRALARPEDFLDVSADAAHASRKRSGLVRDRLGDDTPAFVVQDGNYVSARWPGDVHTFARTFSRLLDSSL
ncbi:type 1 glutamine amidotransferase domain-containing protein [Rhodanobacter sp. MP7CTX1]|uniref:type 1 glutamine amidotransferase domain-containing protein n=1 Tax=Rhodanobacter sp. MP7CTX1 TaxID=2723084 RepID=UPI00160AC39E|nr:type 1 glutamine amidotransferase domain-containing protein [Rhodanobacter sp. MP7CTX1]MBB6185738.1 putative intracellular protease/amidase [Rhodanobacter sp. MP7CTX1]